MAVTLAAVVEMNSNRQHAFQYFHRWLNVIDAVFDGPGTEACHIDSALNGNGSNLDATGPSNSLARFIEQNPARDKGVYA